MEVPPIGESGPDSPNGTLAPTRHHRGPELAVNAAAAGCSNGHSDDRRDEAACLAQIKLDAAAAMEAPPIGGARGSLSSGC